MTYDTKYWTTSTDGLLLIEAWTRDGLTQEQVAKNIGINRGTLFDWKNKYPSVYNALEKGKEVVDIEVENALLKRAKGYITEETVTEITENANGQSTTKTRVVKKEVPPDVGAQVFWLKNRKGLVWKDKIETRNENDTKIEITLTGETKNLAV